MKCMTRCGEHVLLGDDESAHRAVLTFCETACGTGGRNCLVGDLGMTRCGNADLGAENLPAVAALAAVGQTVSGTGGGVALYGHQCVIGAELCGAAVANEVLVFVLVPRGGDGALGAADLMGQTTGAVDDGVIAAIGFAARRNLVFSNGSGGLMGELFQHTCLG